MSSPRILTVRELAAELRVSERLVYEHCTSREPRLPVLRIGRRVLFRESDVQAWIDKQVRGGEAA